MGRILNSKILVTGGAGFIGSNLVDHLIDDNEIVVVDNLSMGQKQNLPKSEHLHFFKQTITDFEFMSSLLNEWKFDYVFLMAAVASVADTIDRPFETHNVNQNANINILETIRINKIPVKKVLFCSSAAVYGNNPELPKNENSVIEPLSPYAIDKFATERFTIDYGNLYDIPTVATRFFNVYGPKQNPKSPYSGVLSLISNAAKRNSEFTVFGDGKQTRDFVYVEDVIEAMEILVTSKKADHDVYNVATSKVTSLNDIISIFERISGKKIKVKYGNSRPGDIKKSYASIDKIELLGFTPKYNVNSGLEKYWSSLN